MENTELQRSIREIFSLDERSMLPPVDMRACALNIVRRRYGRLETVDGQDLESLLDAYARERQAEECEEDNPFFDL